MIKKSSLSNAGRRQPIRLKANSFTSGLLAGAAVMFLLMINIYHGTGNKEPPTDQKLGRRVGSPAEEAEGWHQINVFYGEKAGLGAPKDQEWFAQVHQDEVMMDLIGPNGYFLDLAANDAKEFSNTLSLERHGWNGLCIEPNPRYWYGLSHRKCTVVGALMGASKEKVQVKFRGVYGGIVGRMDEKLANRKKEPNAEMEDRFTAPLTQVLERFNVPTEIDYLSLDVEGAEYLIMKNFPFERYHIIL